MYCQHKLLLIIQTLATGIFLIFPISSNAFVVVNHHKKTPVDVSSSSLSTVTVTSTSTTKGTTLLATPPQEEAQTTPPADGGSNAPVLNGKRVLPFKVLMAGLKGHKVAGVYALMNSEYKRGEEGWGKCEHVGVSMDLDETISSLHDEYGADGRVSHVRALTFVVPSRGAMEDIANEWRFNTVNAGGRINFDPVMAAMELPMEDDDDDDDDDDDEDYLLMTAEAMSAARDSTTTISPPTDDPKTATKSDDNDSDDVVSPFDVSTLPKAASTALDDGKNGDGSSTSGSTGLEFTKTNVDKVLDEVRPYLISDGGNVSVDRVDEEKRDVYLKLEGACGSCPSSTVTMQMGIERVLKENFINLGQVLQVEDEIEKPTELTYQVVENEINRIKPAILAMGGMVEIIKVDPIGVVELKFRGGNKVKQGLELALLDIDFVKHVNFVMGYD